MDIIKGDVSSPILIRPDIADDSTVIDGNWVCQSRIEDRFGNIVIPDRAEPTKTLDELHFVVSLSSDDTNALTLNGELTEYKWVISISNAMLIPTYTREKHVTVVLR